MYFKEQESGTLYFLSVAYKETDADNVCDSRRHLCLANGIHISGICFLSDIRERYNAPDSGNLKYIL